MTGRPHAREDKNRDTDADMHFVWKDPPPREPPWRWAERLAPLREHPGRWASFGTHDRKIAFRINRGECPGIEPGEFRAEMRGPYIRERGELFVQFVGESGLSPTRVHPHHETMTHDAETAR